VVVAKRAPSEQLLQSAAGCQSALKAPLVNQISQLDSLNSLRDSLADSGMRQQGGTIFRADVLDGARELRTRELYKMTLIVEEAPKCEAIAFVALGCREARADQGSKNGAHNIADLE
jgi:hypothetical protein